MKKLLGICLFLIGIGLFIVLQKQEQSSTSPTPAPHQNLQQPVKITSTSLFVPYWTTSFIASGYDTYIYFSIVPSANGIDTTDSGYKGLANFSKIVRNKKTLLAVQMLNTSFTEKVLQDQSLQENIIQDSLQAADAYGFSGIVLDIEYSGLAFPTVTKSLTDFSIRFAKETHANTLTFHQALFGDTYYLARPYTVAKIAENADSIFVMSYDFHKANGTPGPNFPLSKSADSDYTFEQMLTDFSKDVPKEKLVIVFGMFGYDWTIDEKNRSIGVAESISTNEISQKFISKCLFKNCSVNQHDSLEISVTYTDDKNNSHIVWFEDIKSVEKKKEILKKDGISSIGFWANGYFENNPINK